MTLKAKKIFGVSTETELELPVAYPNITAGFPSPAEPYFEERLDLNKVLLKRPAATFLIKVDGDSMIGEGIYAGDTLIVDRSLTPKNNAIVVAALNGELTVKKVKKTRGRLFLEPANPDYEPIEITEDTHFIIWGVITYNIHKLI